MKRLLPLLLLTCSCHNLEKQRIKSEKLALKIANREKDDSIERIIYQEFKAEYGGKSPAVLHHHVDEDDPFIPIRTIVDSIQYYDSTHFNDVDDWWSFPQK